MAALRVGTLRFRVAALATAAVAIVLVVSGVALVVAQERLLRDALDDSLRQRADDLTLVAVSTADPTELASAGDDTIAQLVAADGTVLASSANLAGQPPVATSPTEGSTELRTVGNLPVDEGDQRLLSRSVDGPTGPVVIHVAAPLDDIHESTAALTTSLAVAVPTLVALLAVVMWWLVGRTLRPVEQLRQEVAAIGGADLTRRVVEPPSDDEIARLAHTMNAMLERVEKASERQQQFVADASHELRSPLTRVRAELEVDLAHPATADLVTTHRSVLDETIGMQHLVDDLLHLARHDAGAGVIRREPVDLDDLVLREAARVRLEGHVAVDTTGVAAAQVDGDPGQLARAVRNLADNAARHATSVVTFTTATATSASGDRATLSIADDGPGIPFDRRQRVFERFARLDDARSTATGGTGLGLAITLAIVHDHGGDIVLDDQGNGTGCRVVVTLPVAQAQTSPSRTRRF